MSDTPGNSGDQPVQFGQPSQEPVSPHPVEQPVPPAPASQPPVGRHRSCRSRLSLSSSSPSGPRSRLSNGHRPRSRGHRRPRRNLRPRGRLNNGHLSRSIRLRPPTRLRLRLPIQPSPGVSRKRRSQSRISPGASSSRSSAVALLRLRSRRRVAAASSGRSPASFLCLPSSVLAHSRS